MIQYTVHSVFRFSQWGLSPDEIEYVQIFGTRFHRAGALFYYLRKRDIPLSDLGWNWAMRLIGTALVFTRDGKTLITVWRNRRSGLKRIRRKPKESRKYPLENEWIPLDNPSDGLSKTPSGN